MTKEHSVTEHAGEDGNFKRQTSVYTLTLKGLEDIIEVAILDYELTEKGWSFNRRTKEATGDPVYGKEYLREIYHTHDSDYNLRYTVPVLFDKKQGKVVNNESSGIIRILYTAFDSLLPEGSPSKGKTFYPASHAAQIDDLNGWIYDGINNGVYKAGFAGTQDVYEKEAYNVSKNLDRLEKLLSDGRTYLIPDIGLAEADIRLMPTLIRFDAAYVTLFKCNLRSIRDGYPHIHRYLRTLYWNTPAFQKWTNFYHIKMGYSTVRGKGIMPIGPDPPIMPL